MNPMVSGPVDRARAARSTRHDAASLYMNNEVSLYSSGAPQDVCG